MTSHTPLAVADLIKDIIKDKTVCDVGCGTGDFMVALSQHARVVFGTEEDITNCELASSKGFDVYCGNTFFLELPPADVYYLWTKDQMGVYLKAKHEGTKGVFILGHSVRPATVKFMKGLDAEVRSVDGFTIYITRL